MRGILFICFFIFSIKCWGQDLYFGYSNLHHPNFKKSTSIVNYYFERDIDEVEDNMDFGNSLGGFSFGVHLPLGDFFRTNIDYRRNTQTRDAFGTVSGSRFYPSGEKYLKIKYIQTAFGMDILLGPEQFSIGYGFELARFRRKDMEEMDGEWDKKTRTRNFYFMPKITGRIRLGEPGRVSLLIQPTWRFSKRVYRQDFMPSGAIGEHFTFNSIGGTLGLLIPLVKE